MGHLSSQENWLVVKRQLFAAMMRPTTHIIHNKSDDPNFSTLVTRKDFVRPISPDKFSLRRVIRTTHMGAKDHPYGCYDMGILNVGLPPRGSFPT